MATNEKRIRIFNTISPSLIEAYKKYICYAITNEHIAGNNNLSFVVNENGSFSFRKESGYTTPQSIGNDLNTKKEVDDAIRKLFAAINKQLFNLKDSDKSFEIPFFPLSYLKDISFELIDKKDNTPAYWSCNYKVEVPAYEIVETKDDKVVSRELIKCNVANASLQIDVNTKGRIIGMQYNLLPFAPKSTAGLYPILTKDDEIPQINYLLNTDTCNITPFYLSAGEVSYVPASKESVSPFGNEKTIYKKILLHDKTRNLTLKDKEDLADKIKSGIEKTFGSNGIKIEIAIRWGEKNEKSSKDIYFEVGDDGNRSWAIQGGDNGYFEIAELGTSSYVPAHEFGHIMGLSDRYHYLINYNQTTGDIDNGRHVPMGTIKEDSEYMPYDNLMSSNGGGVLTSYQKNIILRNRKEKTYNQKAFFVNREDMDAITIDFEDGTLVLKFANRKPEPNKSPAWIEPLPLHPEPTGGNPIENIKCDKEKKGERILNHKSVETGTYNCQHPIWVIINQ